MSRTYRAAAVLDAAERWKQTCLLDGGSLFGEERLWTGQHFGELQTYFVERPDESKDRSFLEKLRGQLVPAPPEAKRLWAEMTWVYYLIVSSVKGVTKLDRIRTIWEWSETALPENHWALKSEVLDNGIVHPGRGYTGHQWREYRFLVGMMLDWCGHSEDERKALVNDPWRFAEFVDGQGDSRRQIRHALLYLLFPDEFEPIMTPQHKQEIVRAYGNGSDELPDSGEVNLIGLDKALLKVRRRLTEERPGEEVSFYDEEVRSFWQPSVQEGGADGRRDVDDDQWYANRFGTVDAWVIAPGEGARLWPEFLEAGVAAIGWDGLGDLADYESREAIHATLIASGAGKNPTMQSLAAWEFFHEVAVGDILLAKRGRSAILGWGTVTGDYVHDPERAEYWNTRSVDWHPCDTAIELRGQITTKTLTRFTPYKDWLRDVFEAMDGTGDGGLDIGGADHESYDLAEAASDLFLEEVQLSRMVDAIALHKNLILQGPPGVGKTFIARRIAWCLMGCRNSSAIEMVQFHQSYAYEDFVQGWRPTETGGFTLRSGVFLEFCRRAEANPDRPYVFIIDEINRGNLSRIFGELLMLLEADKRGRDFAIPLTYSRAGERFAIPANVYVLGLMNTADRSLAIVDYALRRRFAFASLEPAYGTRQFREHLLEADMETSLVDRIVRNLCELNERIRGDKDLGPGFEIGHSYFVPEESADEEWYLNTVETQIAPLLREYWFDKPEQVDELVGTLRR